MLRIGCIGAEWSASKGSEAAVEKYGVMESKSRLDGGSNRKVKIRNDWEVDEYSECKAQYG